MWRLVEAQQASGGAHSVICSPPDNALPIHLGERSAVKSLFFFSLEDIDLLSFVPGCLLAINFSQHKGFHLTSLS
jgi:hypothetical protein